MDVQTPARLRGGSAGAWHSSAAIPLPDGQGAEHSSVLELSLLQNFILEVGRAKLCP